MNQRIRGSDVYVVEDIERILVALGATAQFGANPDFVRGFVFALNAVAVATGARLPEALRRDEADRLMGTGGRP